MYKKIISLFIIIALIFAFFQNIEKYNAENAVPAQSASSLDTTTGQISLMFLNGGTSTTYKNQLDKTDQAINVIAPDYFEINDDGSLKILSKISQSFIDELHGKGYKITPYLSNNWDRTLGRMALIKRIQLARQIADAVSSYKLDGINVDIENLTEADRYDFADFVRLVRQNMPSPKILSVSVASNPTGSTKGWGGSYDLDTIQKYCDYVMLMSYDESFSGSPPGPVASATFVRASVENTLKHVPPEKVLVGIPFYGRYWKEGSPDSSGGIGISEPQIKSLMSKYPYSYRYDWEKESANVVVTIRESDTRPVLSGKEWLPGNYNIWYNNDSSKKYILRLVNEYKLLGVGAWRLGQEEADVWKYYKRWLTGRYFEDTVGHWAIDSILEMDERGWMYGTSSNTFSPNQPLTRAQAATVLVQALELSYIDGDNYFSDISGHWAEKYINTARHYEILYGVSENKFDPDTAVTREQMAVMLNNVVLNLEQAEIYTVSTFNDINNINNSWSISAIMRLRAQGILTGYTDNTFRPKNKLTRAEMAKLMEMSAKITFKDIAGESERIRP